MTEKPYAEESTTPNPSFTMDGAREVLQMSGGAIHIERQIIALEDAVIGNPGLAFDLSKTLLETVCKTILEDRGEPVEKHWNMPQLFKETCECLPLVPVSHSDQPAVTRSLVKTLKGLQTVVQGLCELRNMEGFASHGKDGYTLSLDPLQAEMAARAADALVHYLYKAHQSYPRDLSTGRLPIEHFEAFNEYIDDIHDVVGIFDLQYLPSEVLLVVDKKAYREKLAEYMSQVADRESVSA